MVSESALATLHALQTAMGDLHDLEVLSSSLARRAEKASPERAAELAPVLAELEAKHSRILQSVLTSADAILEHWEEALAPPPAPEARAP